MCCPRCGCCQDEITWSPGECQLCGLPYGVDQVGETWTGDEFPVPVWSDEIGEVDAFDCGVNAYYAEVDRGFDMECPFGSDADRSTEWHRGYNQAKADSE